MSKRVYFLFSDLAGSKHLSDSKTSLSERVGSFKDSARKTLGRLRRAISLERVSKEEEDPHMNPSGAMGTDEGRLKKSPSLRSLTDKLPFKKTKKEGGGR